MYRNMIRGITLLCCLFAFHIHAEDPFQILSHANNKFALDFYKIHAKREGNLLYSPLSLHSAISLLYQGAAGLTKNATEQTLHVFDKAFVAKAYKELMNHYEEIEDINVVLANRLYYQNEYKLKETLKNVLNEKYESGVESIDFSQNDAADIINNYVANKTANKITGLFAPSDFKDKTILVLLNTLYFSGAWGIPFMEEEYTYVAPFYVNSTNIVKAKTMSTQDVYMAAEDSKLGASVLELPFIDGNFSMVVILPNNFDGIEEVESKFNYEELKRVLGELEERYLSIHFPKFNIEQHIDLRDPLTELGLGVIFDKDNCDLSEMFEDTSIYVSKAYQKVYISVDEQGCEAAAATGFALIDRINTFSWKFNHPFIFMIMEKFPAGFNILFTGRVTDPTL